MPRAQRMWCKAEDRIAVRPHQELAVWSVFHHHHHDPFSPPYKDWHTNICPFSACRSLRLFDSAPRSAIQDRGLAGAKGRKTKGSKHRSPPHPLPPSLSLTRDQRGHTAMGEARGIHACVWAQARNILHPPTETKALIFFCTLFLPLPPSLPLVSSKRLNKWEQSGAAGACPSAHAHTPGAISLRHIRGGGGGEGGGRRSLCTAQHLCQACSGTSTDATNRKKEALVRWK